MQSRRSPQPVLQAKVDGICRQPEQCKAKHQQRNDLVEEKIPGEVIKAEDAIQPEDCRPPGDP